jgi:putative peptidoglycan lipid II flippase
MPQVRQRLRQLTDVLSREQTHIIRAAGLVMIPGLLTKFSGLLFKALTATQLSTSTAYRDFLFANTLPEMLATILLTGAVSTLIIPILIEAKEHEGEDYFRNLFNSIVNLIMGIFIVVAILVIIFAEPAFPLIVQYIIRPAPDVDIMKHAPTIIAMMRVLMLPQIILGISVFVTSGLNVYNRLILPQLAPLFYNFGRIFSVFVLLPIMDKNPWALVYGVIIGSVLHLVIQLPLAKTLHLTYRPVLNLNEKYIRRFFKVVIPRAFAFAADTISLTLAELIGSGLAEKAYPALQYANDLALVIPSLFGYSFAVASFPTLSQLYVRKNFTEMNLIISRTINQIFFLTLPLVVTFIILRLPIVRLVYGVFPRTQFDREDTAMVAWVLFFYCLGIIFTSCNWYLYRLFFIIRNTLVPTLMSVLFLVLTIVSSVMFSNLLSHSDNFSFGDIHVTWHNLLTQEYGRAAVGGIALAISFVAFLQFLLLIGFTHKMVATLDFGFLIKEMFKKLIPTLAMGSLMFMMFKSWDTLTFPIDATAGFSGSTTLNLFLLTMITMITCFLVYYLLCLLFQVEDLKVLRRFLNPVFRLGGLRIQ